MVTLRFDFHIGSVECVTYQRPVRNSIGGVFQVEEVVPEAGEVDGARKGSDLSVLDSAAGAAMVVWLGRASLSLMSKDDVQRWKCNVTWKVLCARHGCDEIQENCTVAALAQPGGVL